MELHISGHICLSIALSCSTVLGKIFLRKLITRLRWQVFEFNLVNWYSGVWIVNRNSQMCLGIRNRNTTTLIGHCYPWNKVSLPCFVHLCLYVVVQSKRWVLRIGMGMQNISYIVESMTLRWTTSWRSSEVLLTFVKRTWVRYDLSKLHYVGVSFASYNPSEGQWELLASGMSFFKDRLLIWQKWYNLLSI